MCKRLIQHRRISYNYDNQSVYAGTAIKTIFPDLLVGKGQQNKYE